MDKALWNTYAFHDTRDLRAFLKKWKALRETADDVDAATIVFDLGRVLGEVPGALTPLTQRQQQAIRLHLLQDVSIHLVAEQMDISERAVNYVIKNGLQRLRYYLQTGVLPKYNCADVWTEDDVHMLVYYASLPRKQLAMMLHRSVSSIYQKLTELRSNGLLIVIGRAGKPLSCNDVDSRASA